MRLESERLNLRTWSNDDFDRFAAFYADERYAEFVGGACDRGDAWRRFAGIVGHWQLRGYGFWALEEKSSGDVVGGCGLWFPEGWPELEVGYWLHPEAHGKGYATEAAARAKRYAFEELGAATLVSYIDEQNAPSIAVAERLGATYDGTIELAKFGPHRVYRHPRP